MAETVTANHYRAAFERLVEEKGLKNHALMKQWIAGSLPLSVVKAWCKEMYSWSADVLRGFAAVYLTAPKFQVRHKMILNLAEEHGITELVVRARHADLIKTCGMALGTPESEYDSHVPIPEQIALTDRYIASALTEGYLEGLATIGIEEFQFAPISATLYDSMIRHYKVAPADAIWFKVHGAADIEHGERALEDFAAYGPTPELRDRIVSAASRSLDAMWNWHEGIYRRFQ